ncbi:hypothetical protein LbFV_ORF92 [Leptopilina boulardi filamentous virus]|uniref:Uncharacterized protein n=1 Tax=Leptopilina boulardi filamentous virus TaxID=552509 RepID=A0A1S5YD44_9VIRU|nr:hypothetical protein LbFV_ORF92 [Leptopilina boulardi filamentous virus]AQQ80012.1 hypothetical protein LbFV_ORF92 [Leptopilina boulardi filamentous virus]
MDRYFINEMQLFERKLTFDSNNDYHHLEIISSHENQHIKKTKITLFTYNLLLDCLHYFYMKCVDSNLFYDSGLTLVLHKEKKIFLNQLIFDVDFKSANISAIISKEKINDYNDFLNERNNIIKNMIYIIFKYLKIDFTVENIQKYCSVTSRPLKLSFHLHIFYHVDYFTERILRFKMHNNWKTFVTSMDTNFILDEPILHSLPFSRQHRPNKIHCQQTESEDVNAICINVDLLFLKDSLDISISNETWKLFSIFNIEKVLLKNISLLTKKKSDFTILIKEDYGNEINIFNGKKIGFFSFEDINNFISTSMEIENVKNKEIGIIDEDEYNIHIPSVYINHIKRQHKIILYDIKDSIVHESIDSVLFFDLLKYASFLSRYNKTDNFSINLSTKNYNENENIDEFYETVNLFSLKYKKDFFSIFDDASNDEKEQNNIENSCEFDENDVYRRGEKNKEEINIICSDEKMKKFQHFSDSSFFPFTEKQIHFLESIINKYNEDILSETDNAVCSKVLEYLESLNSLYPPLLFLLGSSFFNYSNDEDLQLISMYINNVDVNLPKIQTNKKRKLTTSKVDKNDIQRILKMDYKWIKEILNYIINCGCVTSSVYLLSRIGVFQSLFDNIYYILSSMSLTLHAQYILSKWIQIVPEPITFFSSSFYNSDIAYMCLILFDFNEKSREHKEKKNFLSGDNLNIKFIYSLFIKILSKFEIEYNSELEVFFITQILMCRSLGYRAIYFNGHGHVISQDTSFLKDFCEKKSTLMLPKYKATDDVLNSFVYIENVGIFNTLFNVYEFPSPSLNSLVTHKLPSVLTYCDNNINYFSHTTYPLLQNFIFELYGKMFHFSKKCKENVVSLILFSPNVRISKKCPEILMELDILNFYDSSFIFLLEDYAKILNNHSNIEEYWNDDFISIITTTNDKYSFFLKRLLFIFYIIFQENKILNFSNIILFIQTLFGQSKYEQLGLRKQTFFKNINANNNKNNNNNCTTTDDASNGENKDIEMIEDDKLYHKTISYSAKHFTDKMEDNTCFFNDIRKRINSVLYEQHELKKKIINETILTTKIIKPSLLSKCEEQNNYMNFCLSDYYENVDDIILPFDKNDKSLFNTKIKNHFLNVLLNIDNSENNDYIELISSIDLTKQFKKNLYFLVLLLNWFLKMGNIHAYSNTSFFKDIQKYRQEIYNLMTNHVLKSFGPLLKFSSSFHLANIIQKFNENTELDFDFVLEKFSHLKHPFYEKNNNKKLLNNENIKKKYFSISDRDIIADNEMLRSKNHIYHAMAVLLMFSEFNFDTLTDVIKFMIYILYKGNMLRICLYLFGVTESLKSRFTEILANLTQTDQTQSFNNANISRSAVQDFDSIVISGASNTFIFFDEVEKVCITRFKTIVNSIAMSSRDIKNSEAINLKLACTPLMSSNSPFVVDNASCARLRPIRKKMQFCETFSGETFDRFSIDSLKEYISTPNIGGIFLINRIPMWHDNSASIIGFLLIQRYLYPYFFKSYTSPISKKMSKTMKNELRIYMSNNHPVAFFLNTVKISVDHNFISEQDFYKLIDKWWLAYKDRFKNSDFDSKSLVKEISQYLTQYKSTLNNVKGYNIKIVLE